MALNSYNPFKSLCHFKNHVKVFFFCFTYVPCYFEPFFQPDEKEQKEQKDFVDFLTARVEGEDPEIVVDKENQGEGNTLLHFL